MISDGMTLFSFEYPIRLIPGHSFRCAVVSVDNTYIIACTVDKMNKDCLSVYNASSGNHLLKIPLKACNIKEIQSIIPLPHKANQVVVITSEKGSIIDIKTKKHIRSIPKWGGSCTKDGKFGLYAPSRGGLECLELRKGTTVKTFIPKVAEGVFTVICMFTETDEYVLYYHSGKKTLRVFRTTDTVMIANYRMQAELTAIKSTSDGRCLVLGTVDGCISVLAIADPLKADTFEYLEKLPSRDADVRINLESPFHQCNLTLINSFQWKKKLAKMKAATRFKAAMRLAKMTARFSTPSFEDGEVVSTNGET